MPDPPYDVGEVVRHGAVLTDTSTGTARIPSAVSFQSLSPTGALLTYAYGGASTPSAVASGVYSIEVPVTAPGIWSYRWVATGPNSVEEYTLPVASSRF
jgi:hypothetical protein